MGAMLRRVGRIREVDEELMARLGRGFTQIDPVGAAIADALRRPEGDPDRVTMAQLRRAIADGISAVPDAPAPLSTYIATVSATPDWVDFDLIDQGARAVRRMGGSAADALLQLSLIGGYRFGGPTDLLVATGGLVGDSTVRRLAETQEWVLQVTEVGGLRPGATGWRDTVHVRAMHALVNASFAPRWDARRWGAPINQSDQAATLGLFSGVLLLGVRALGVPLSREDSRAVMHLWKYTGWLMGVDEQWLVDTEAEQHHLNYHVLLAQDDLTDAGPALSQAIVEGQLSLHVSGPVALRRRYARARLLSMLTVFLGRESMRELGLQRRLPWAFALAVATNVWHHRVLGRLPGAADRLERRGARQRRAIVNRYFGRSDHEVAALPI